MTSTPFKTTVQAIQFSEALALDMLQTKERIFGTIGISGHLDPKSKEPKLAFAQTTVQMPAGFVTVNLGDWIIQFQDGQLSTAKEADFAKIYSAA